MGKRKPLSHSVTEDTLEKFDTRLKEEELTRYAFFNKVIFRFIQKRITLTGVENKKDDYELQIKAIKEDHKIKVRQLEARIKELQTEFNNLGLDDPKEAETIKHLFKVAISIKTKQHVRPLNDDEYEYALKIVYPSTSQPKRY